MSEASEDKTKRKFITLIQSYPWECKVNLYFRSYEFGKDIYKYLTKLNSSLRTKNPDIGIVYRVCLNNARKAGFTEYKEGEFEDRIKWTTAPMITYFCQAEPVLPDLSRIRSFNIGEYKYTKYHQNEETITKYINTVKRQRPHDLEKYLNETGQRYGRLNRKCFTKDMNSSN